MSLAARITPANDVSALKRSPRECLAPRRGR
jgi:hypothetical protein